MAPTSDDAIAINTAKASAVRTKLNPRGNSYVIVITRPARMAGASNSEHTSDTETSKSETRLRVRSDTFPITGRMNDPITGTKTQANR